MSKTATQTGSDEGVLVGEFAKNSRETVQVRLTTYQGHPLCDVRIWAKPLVPGDPPRATHKGVCFNRGFLGELIELLQQAQEGDRAE